MPHVDTIRGDEYPVPSYPSSQHTTYYDTSHTAITWNSETNQLWDVFFTDYVTVSPENFEANPNYYSDLFGRYYADATIAGKTSQADWKTFLDGTDIHLRHFSPFIWIYRLFGKVITEMQRVTVNEAERVSTLTLAQQAAVSALAHNVKFTSFTESSDVTAQFQNQQYQQWAQSYLGYKATIGGSIDSVNNSTQQISNNIQAEASVMAAMIQQLQSVISAIFQ